MMPADLALISADASFFARAVNINELSHWSLRDCRLILLPLSCKAREKALKRGLLSAALAGCRVAALPPELRRGLISPPLPLADGRLFALSALPRLLDLDCPGWRCEPLSLCAADSFSCLTARWLAPHAALLHIFGAEEKRRLALTQLLFRESGLIAGQGPNPRPGSIVINPPQAVEASSKERAIPGHLAEALLLSAGGLPASYSPLPLLRLLNRRALYHGIMPI